ncbi:MAG: hypothetical protein MJ238_01945 [Bacilli bacterium]|nr:hypothetical protein [Bacilli bacterium]
MDSYFFTRSILAESIDLANDPVLLALIIIGGVVLVGGIIALYFVFFKKKGIDKKVAELEASFSTAHGLLFGEICTAIKRLEAIGSVNLCYVDEYSQENRAYKDVRNVLDASAQAVINELKDLKQEKKYKELKESLPKARETISEYVESVTRLKNTLDQKFLVENQCKDKASRVKQDVRSVKMLYNNHASELNLVVNPLNIAFTNLDRALESIEYNIESAHYEEAQDTIGKVSAMVAGLNVVLKELPQICVQLSSVLPDKIISLKNRYEDLTKEGYPLHQITSRAAIEGYNNDLETMKATVLRLSIDGINDKINLIHQIIDKANESIDGEIKAKAAFVAEKDEVISLQNSTSCKATNLNRDIEKIKQIYNLNDQDQEDVKKILQLDEQAETSKRVLDTFVNSATKQPFTVLLDKLHAVRDQAQLTCDAVQAFETHLLSFKEDVVRARATNHDYYLKLKEIEAYLHSTNMPSLKEKYDETIDNLYSYIDEMSQLVQMRPIDVRRINAIQATIVKDGNALISDVNQQVSTLNQAEAGIVNANRNRALNTAVDQSVTQAEQFFFGGEFDEALSIINTVQTNLQDPDFFDK